MVVMVVMYGIDSRKKEIWQTQKSTLFLNGCPEAITTTTITTTLLYGAKDSIGRWSSEVVMSGRAKNSEQRRYNCSFFSLKKGSQETFI
jgi:hypothetical protein